MATGLNLVFNTKQDQPSLGGQKETEVQGAIAGAVKDQMQKGKANGRLPA